MRYLVAFAIMVSINAVIAIHIGHIAGNEISSNFDEILQALESLKR